METTNQVSSDLVCMFPSLTIVMRTGIVFPLMMLKQSPKKGGKVASYYNMAGYVSIFLGGTKLQVSQGGDPEHPPCLLSMDNDGHGFPMASPPALFSFGIPLRYSRLGLASSAWLVQKFHPL